MSEQGEQEVPLTGGNASEGVVRVGGTVRRPWGAHSDFTRLLLQHLEAVGFTGAPRYLGVDEQGRQILEYLEGWVPHQVTRLTDQQVDAAGTLLQGFHESTRGSSLAGGEEVVCHGDLNLRNLVFRDRRPVALLDFDQAAPGRAITDLAYLGWNSCLSSYWEDRSAHFQAAQLRRLADAYGLDPEERRTLPPEILLQQERVIQHACARLSSPRASLPLLQQQPGFWEGVLEWAAQDHGFLQGNLSLFEAVCR